MHACLSLFELFFFAKAISKFDGNSPNHRSFPYGICFACTDTRENGTGKGVGGCLPSGGAGNFQGFLLPVNINSPKVSVMSKP